MTVRYTAEAQADFDEILFYIRAENPDAAIVLATAITATASRLGSFPHLGVKTDEPEIRVIMARPYRYLILYRVAADAIVIRNIRHPARRRPS